MCEKRRLHAIPQMISGPYLHQELRSSLEPSTAHCTSTVISQYVPPRIKARVSAVKIPAPALDPVVIFSSSHPGCVSVLGSVPAFGSPLLVAPVSSVNGGDKLSTRIRFDEIAASAHICWPTPVDPSHVVDVQSYPQTVPLSPPLHCVAAPAAEA